MKSGMIRKEDLHANNNEEVDVVLKIYLSRPDWKEIQEKPFYQELLQHLDRLGKESPSEKWEKMMEDQERKSPQRGVARPRGTDSAKIIKVIETKSLRGKGTPDDPCRIVRQYWSFNGKLLAENDPDGKDPDEKGKAK